MDSELMTRGEADHLARQLVKDLVRDEGYRKHPYRDSVGVLTVAIGRNLESKGINKCEAEYLCVSDILDVVLDFDHNIPWWNKLSPNRKLGLLNMGFNLGWPKLSKFKLMLTALEDKDWAEASLQALDSKWANQVGDRAKRIAMLFHNPG